MASKDRKKRYARARANGKSKTAAAIEAGCPPAGAHTQGYRLEKDPEVQAYIQAIFDDRRKRSGEAEKLVIQDLVEIRTQAMEGKPVLDKEGKPTGEKTKDLRLALHSVAMLGKYLGLFTPRKDGHDKSIEELVAGSWEEEGGDPGPEKN